jgi:sugar lactone lactonase YvrE
MTRWLGVLWLAVLLVGSAASAQTDLPRRIDLPDGFRPEGIAIRESTFYVGSIPTGAVYRGNLRTGEGSIFVPAQEGRAAIGMKVDRGRLFVAGGPTGGAWVYDARTGATIASYSFTGPPTFVNDVIVTDDAAWFTDSLRAVLYRVPLAEDGSPSSTFQTVRLEGDLKLQEGFNANGIAASPDGETLIIVQTNTGKLFRVLPENRTARTDEIELAGGASVPMGDGILLDGRTTLYVVRNFANVVVKIRLSSGLRSGTVLREIRNDSFRVPTTIAERGEWLYAVNARFDVQNPGPTTEYWITRFSK